jgi:hypothetical protein
MRDHAVCGGRGDQGRKRRIKGEEMRILLCCIGLLAVTACDEAPKNQAEFNTQLRKVLHEKPAGSPRAYAIVKNGVGGADWLATIHGYADNKSVCEDEIKPYNANPDLSTLPGSYACEEI